MNRRSTVERRAGPSTDEAEHGNEDNDVKDGNEKDENISNIDETDEFEDVDVGSPGVFHPLSICVEVEAIEGDGKLVACALVLPTGATTSELSLSVSENGLFLEIEYMWPEVLTTVTELLKFRLKATNETKIEIYHPLYTAFRNFFRFYRSKPTDRIKTKSLIRLPSKVESNFESPKILKWKEKMFSEYRIMFVTLRCTRDDYTDSSQFVEVEI